MYIGAISGVIGGFFYQSNAGTVIPALAILIPLACCLLGSLLVSLLYCFLTVNLKANQNVTGLAITTFGVGFGNFFGGSLIKIVKSDVPYLALVKIAKAYKTTLPFAKDMGQVGQLFLLIRVFGLPCRDTCRWCRNIFKAHQNRTEAPFRRRKSGNCRCRRHKRNTL